MDAEKEASYLWNIYHAISEWIKFSDTKAAGILAANGVIAGFAFASSSLVNSLLDDNFLFPGLLIIGSIALTASSIFCIWSLIPNLSVGEPKSIIYFAHIAKQPNPDAYRIAVATEFKENDASKHIADQIWAISRVAWQKYVRVSRALWCLAASLLAMISFIALAIVLPPSP